MTDIVWLLRDQASPKPTAIGITLSVLLVDAADEIEGLRSELSLARQRKISARNEINRAMDRHLKEDKP